MVPKVPKSASVYFPEAEMHDDVRRAAELEGVTVNEFIVGSVTARAKKVIEKTTKPCSACGGTGRTPPSPCTGSTRMAAVSGPIAASIAL